MYNVRIPVKSVKNDTTTAWKRRERADQNNVKQGGCLCRADAVVYVMVGDELKRTYTLPAYADIETASVIRINLFYYYDSAADAWYEYFQIAPDIRALQSTAQIKSIDHGGVITVKGRRVDR